MGTPGCAYLRGVHIFMTTGPCSILEYDVTIYHVHKNEFERASPTRCLTLLVLLLAFPLFEYPPVVHQRLEVGVKCIFNHHHNLHTYVCFKVAGSLSAGVNENINFGYGQEQDYP